MGQILLIEDNEMNRDMLSRRLQRRGYRVDVAESAEQGIEMVERDRPELILMDISLPGMDGWQATRILKGRPETASIPVIALTAHAMTSDREKAVEAGCDGFETKPVEFETLVARIEQLLAKS
jgi:CheY-like chemotaxis protein